MKKFLFSNCVINNDKLFATGVFGGIPVIMDLDDEKIDVCNFMDGFVFRKKNVVVDFFVIFENNIYALDSGEDSLVVWDFNNKSCQSIFLGCSHQTWINFSAFERYGRDFYIFPKYENKILIYHIDTNDITEITGYLDNNDGVQCACRAENSVWILPQYADAIYCYDLENRKSKRYNLKKLVNNCVHAIYKDGWIYILNKFGIIYKWDIDKKELREITCLQTIDDEAKSMSRIVVAENRLVLLPAYGEDIKILDITTGQSEIYHDYPDDFAYHQTGWLKYYGYCENEEYYYFAVCAGNYMLKIEKVSGELIWIRPKSDLLGGQIIHQITDRVICESNLELTDLFRIESATKSGSDRTNIGKRIYCEIGDI